MFSYYGRKEKLAKKYPQPIYNTIIEPFAGSAAYSLHADNWRKNVILIDKNEKIYAIWKWLQKCTWKDIADLPVIEEGKTTKDYDLDPIARDFIGFWIGPGSSSPRYKAGKFNNWNEQRKIQIASNLCKIKHWDIRLGSYEDLPNIEATWFIDPPYQFSGSYYVKSSKHIDYSALAKWCESRLGQVIVCENIKATWMKFEPFQVANGQRYVTMEAIWYREKNNVTSTTGNPADISAHNEQQYTFPF